GEKLRDRILPPLLDGTGLIALGMSEPEAGSAVTDLRTTARVEGDWCVVNGTKMWSTNSTDATVFLVYARFGPGARGIGSVIVERDAPGLTVGPPETYMSGEQWSLLTFDDCRVPVENVLIDSDGFKRQISAFNVERIGNATRALSLGRLCYSTARDHAATRKQFGKTLSEFQGVQWKFAEMTVQLDAAQLLLYRAASDLHDGLPRARETAIAKYACNTAGFNAANESLQVMGAMGYSTQTLVEYCLRRTRGWMIAGGSLEMLRNRIAESVFGTRFSQRAS
ncbi:MAG: acyl-CoA dehydrogenase, partial [Trebonia sp.]